MSITIVDTLKIADKLEQGGFTNQQARAAASAFAEATQGAGLVTKKYFKEHLDHRIQMSEQRMTIRLGGMMVVLAGLIIGAFRMIAGH